jgi:hypothetical protein
MQSQFHHLPERFPIGTRYVVEARRSSGGNLRVESRYVEFPDGRHVDLPAPAAQKPARRRRRRTRQK